MSIELIAAFVCMVAFFRAGRLDATGEAHDYAFPWALMSVLVSALVLVGLKGSWFVLMLCQIGLFLGIGVYRALRDPT